MLNVNFLAGQRFTSVRDIEKFIHATTGKVSCVSATDGKAIDGGNGILQLKIETGDERTLLYEHDSLERLLIKGVM